jgi:5-hydroxyisourate hydrolase
MPAAVTQIALRFAMTDPEGAYHMPIILNPNSYSMWTSR